MSRPRPTTLPHRGGHHRRRRGAPHRLPSSRTARRGGPADRHPGAARSASSCSPSTSTPVAHPRARRAVRGHRHRRKVTQAPWARRRRRARPFTLAVTDAAGRVLGTQDVTAATTGPSPRPCPARSPPVSPSAAAHRPGAARSTRRTTATPPPTPAPPASLSPRRDRGLRVENSFVSSVGWVKPGESYPSRIIVTNPTATRSPAPRSPSPPRAAPASPRPPAPARHRRRRRRSRHLDRARRRPPAAGPPTLVLEHRAAPLDGQLPTIVWRDLSTRGRPDRRAAQRRAVTSHGPKVIPPDEIYDTARYGDRPFPVVPVQYPDRAYQADHSGDQLEKVINDPDERARPSTSTRRCRSGSSSPRAPCPRPASPPPTSTTSPGFDFTRRRPRANTCTGADLRRLPVAGRGHPALPRADHRRRLQPARQHRLLRRRRQRLGGRSARSPASARCSTSTAAAARRQDRLRRRGDRRPGDRLLRLRHRQGRRRRLLHGRLRRLRRQRRLPARRLRGCDYTDAPVRQRLAALLLAGVLLHRPGHRACPASPPTTSSRTSRAGRSGTPTTAYQTMTTDDKGDASRCSSGSVPTT